MHKLVLLLLLLAVTAFSTHAETVETEQFETVRTIAILLEPLAPVYPAAELARGQQGWVDLSYVVTPQGNVVDPVVVDSSGSRHFERAARKAASSFRYKPATVNGKPVQQCDTKTRITFAMEGEETTVGKKFYHRYRQIRKALKQDDVAGAEELLDAAFEMKGLTLAEMAWLWTARARLLGKTGTKKEQLHAVRQATSSPDWINDDLYVHLLQVRTTWELQEGLYSDALQTHALLMETEANDERTAALANAVGEVEDLFAGDKILSVDAEIEAEENCDDCKENWHYSPVRRQFQIVNIDGHLDTVDVRCDWQRFINSIDPNGTEVWKLPESWGDCSVFVFGEPGTTFSFYEMPSDYMSAR